MLTMYRTENDQVFQSEELLSGTWVYLVDPTEAEVQSITSQLKIDLDFVRAALDEEERPRIEIEHDQKLIIVDVSIVEAEGAGFVYTTIPLAIIMTEEILVTVCLKDLPLLRDFIDGRVRGFSTKKKNRFVLQILYRNAARFLSYLRQIDKASTRVEGELHKSMKNKELIQMLKLEKSLVYFSTSLKGNEAVMERMLRMDFVRQYADDTDLLEDVIIENKQAIEMCNIYRDILSGTMDAFASVISNNLNIVMKLLTSLTIVISIPTLVASLWGMNVEGLPFSGAPQGFWIVSGIALALSLIGAFIMYRKKMF